MSEHPMVCLHEDRWQALMKQLSEMTAKVDRMHDRLFVDNGKPSMQTSLIQGDARFARIETHLAGLAQSMKRNADTSAGVAVEQATLEGLVLEAVKKFGTGKAASSHTSMWLAITVVSICATAIVYKVL